MPRLEEYACVDQLRLDLIDEKHWMPNSSFINNFFLTYRFFLKDPKHLFSIFIRWFDHDALKEKVAKLIIRWIDQNMIEFETNAALLNSLVSFMQALRRENMILLHARLLALCSKRSHVRIITVSSEEMKNSEVKHVVDAVGVFISSDQCKGRIGDAGIFNGDQILEINGTQLNSGVSCLKISDYMNKSSPCVMQLKWNPSALHSILSKDPSNAGNSKFYINPSPAIVRDGSILRHFNSYDESKAFRVINRSNRRKSNFIPTENNENDLTDRLAKLLKKLICKQSGFYLSKTVGDDSRQENFNLSRSNPDWSYYAVNRCDMSKASTEPDILRIYRSDQSSVFLPVYKNTTAQNVVQLAVRDFGLMTGKVSSLEWALCRVTCEKNGAIVQKRLSNNVQNLLERLSLNSRYYLKNLLKPDNVLPDELAHELYDDSRVDFLRLDTRVLAAYLTLRDFENFSRIEPCDFVEDLLRNNNIRRDGAPVKSEQTIHSGSFSNRCDFRSQNTDNCHEENHSKIVCFEKIVNREMWWVATEICQQQSASKRVRSLKKFIKLANRCRELQNFNSMFAILSGLEKPAVKRLTSTWDRLPSKYRKIFQKMQLLLDPSRNMAKYRASLEEAIKNPPVLPVFPLICKDLYFLHECNKTWMDSDVVNWGKMSMIAEKLQSVRAMTLKSYVLSDILNDFQYDRLTNIPDYSFCPHLQSSARKNGFSRRTRYERDRMISKCNTYLNNLCVLEDEAEIETLSLQCQPYCQNRISSERSRRRQVIISRSNSNCGSLFSIQSGTSTLGSVSTKNSPSLLHTTEDNKKIDLIHASARKATVTNDVVKDNCSDNRSIIHMGDDNEFDIDSATLFGSNRPKIDTRIRLRRTENFSNVINEDHTILLDNLTKTGSQRPLIRPNCTDNLTNAPNFDMRIGRTRNQLEQLDETQQPLAMMELKDTSGSETEFETQILHV